jgi:hypothetical protein
MWTLGTNENLILDMTLEEAIQEREKLVEENARITNKIAEYDEIIEDLANNSPYQPQYIGKLVKYSLNNGWNQEVLQYYIKVQKETRELISGIGFVFRVREDSIRSCDTLESFTINLSTFELEEVSIEELDEMLKKTNNTIQTIYQKIKNE